MKTKLIILTLLLSLSFSSYGGNFSEILPLLKQVETNGDIKAIGDDGKAFGILQIHKVCIDDVNRMYGTHYTHKDAFSERCSEEIFRLYINAGIDRFVAKYHTNPTEQDIVRMWNGGIYDGYSRRTTVKYYKRYLIFKKRILLA
jgi:hypothetical protein